MQPISCNCEKCQRMCEGSTCLPTPQEAAVLVSRFPGRMAEYVFSKTVTAPAPAGREGQGLPLCSTNLGRCTFRSVEGCELHELGLKPMEGRLAHHDRDTHAVRMSVLATWN